MTPRITKRDQLINRAVGRRIKELRSERKLSRYRLAQMADVAHPVITYVESGKGIKVCTLIKIIQGMKMTMSQFWKGVGS